MTEEQMWQTGIVCALLLITVFLLLGGFKSLRCKRKIENVPTSKVAGVFLGLSEVKGDARPGPRPLRSYLAEVPCVWYRYSVEEHWQKTETYTDSDGKRKTRTTSGWTTIKSHEGRERFFVEDDTGKLRIDPVNAEIEGHTVMSRTCGRSDPLYYAKGGHGSVANSTHTRRFHESAIKIGATIYVIGCARLRDDIVEPEIACADDEELYLISVNDEEKILRSYAWGSFFKLFFGAVCLNLAPNVALWQPSHQAWTDTLVRATPLMIVGTLLYGLGVFTYYLFLVYNGLVNVRNRLRMAWSMIDVQLKRRHDLIPNLVAAVKGYAQHEAGLLGDLAKIRVEGLKGASGGVDLPTAGAAAAVALAANEQTHALGGLFGIVERYPKIKADKRFGKLMHELETTETKIALARAFYNESVTALNNRIETMPDALIASFGNFKKAEWFKIEDFEARPVTVKLEDETPRLPEPPPTAEDEPGREGDEVGREPEAAGGEAEREERQSAENPRRG